ncbi:hypothetical protein WG68_05900 [Arsukibacterium ikkense]|uniref:Uncharacterized protein n=1 Tax=Arsukibacterium ikkense TaxID=336831 RepID=A0A0M2VAY5_9GAMM|nr:TolB family protein [Arsukibacterium ikkense]KKO46303.1 hypothetical protein WG68_05900 [Arsukibacterium ikkense]
MALFKCTHLAAGVLALCGSLAVAAGLQHDLAFVSIRDGNAHIYVSRGDGTQVALTSGSSVNTQPAWSADGTMLAFSSVRDGQSAIYIIGADGQDLRRLNQSTLWQTAPSWSPDGKAIAFFARDNSKPGVALHLMDLTDRTALIIDADGMEKGPDAPVWSADGKQLAFLGSHAGQKNDVWVVQRDGSGLQNISQQVSTRHKAHPAMSPDGRYVVYVADMRGYLALFRTDLQTGESVNLTADKPAAYETPRWSADGRRLVFASSRDDPELTRMDIFMMNADGSGVTNLSQHPHEDFNPHWSADEQRIIFTSLRSGTAQIFAYDLVSKQLMRITDNQSHDMDQVPQPVAVRFLQTAVSLTKGDL